MSAKAGEAGNQVDIATQSLARPAALMAVGTALSRVTGLGRIVALAVALGVAESRLADAYNIANTVPLVLYELVLGGILTSIFIPVVVQELRTHDDEEARASVSALVTAAIAALVGMTVLLIALAPWLIDLFSDRVSGPEGRTQHDLATFFLRMFAPQVALFGVSAVAAALVNAHGRFGPPMFAPVVNNVILIATFLVFAAVTTGVPTEATVEDDLGLKLLLAAGRPGRWRRWRSSTGTSSAASACACAPASTCAIPRCARWRACRCGRCSTSWSTRSGRASRSTWPTAGRAARPPT